MLNVTSTGTGAGRPVRLTTGLEPHSVSLSRDGTKAVYTRYFFRRNVWALPLLASGTVTMKDARPVTSGNQVVESHGLSRDGKWLAFDANLEGNQDIYLVSVTGGEPRRLTVDSAAEFHPAFSPDGRSVVFHSAKYGTRDIFLVEVNGGSPQRLTDQPGEEFQPSFSPDGRRIAYGYEAVGENSAYVISRDSLGGAWRAPRRVSRGPATYPRWSPDGVHLVGTRGYESIILLGLDGSEREILKAADERLASVAWPTFSPDGRNIYFHAVDQSGRPGLYAVSPNGGRARLAVRFSDASRPVGGKTWAKVLAGMNASTGCSMMSMDPSMTKTIYAGMWDFRRKGWTFRSGGDGPEAPSGSGLFKSTDGGATWKELTSTSAGGLPPKPWGRVAVTVAPSKPNVVYAFIEAVPPHNALYRSDDGGATWSKRDRSQNMIWRPFYFANIIVDPKNENRVIKPDGPLIMSTDGGVSFSNISGGTHGDHHDIWIDPQNTERMITGDDGGIWYSYDGGDRWWKGENLPISQFYHVSVDMDRPYKVYGGLQDNSSWVGESQYPGGIAKSQWENMYGGDGFWMFVDPTDPTYIYAESQGGYIARINRFTHETRDIKPLPSYKEEKLRFNWNAPIHVSPTRNGTIYLGSQYLHRSRDFGQTWERISPDLTTNDPEKQKQEQSGGVTVDNSSAETHTTIFAIHESPRNPLVIWVGTDDGNVQVTRDAGKTWTNVVSNIQGLPKNAWVTTVEPGHFDTGTIYATFDAHTFGDMRPYAYKSTDYGNTWTSLIAADAPVHGYAHVIKEDLVNPRLLFMGTELGLWVSVDAGASWSRYKGGDLPSVAVRDLAIHPREHDLVIGTHGRGIWIIDDITPLRSLTPETLARGGAFVQTTPAVQRIGAFGGWANGDAEFIGPNPPNDAVITYYLQKRHIFGDMKLEVLDSAGKLLTTLPTSKRRGLSRVTWSMRMPPARIPPAATAAFGPGPRYMPGTYTVRLVEGDSTYTTKLRVTRDAAMKHTIADRQAQFALSLKLYEMLDEMTGLVERMNALRAELENRQTGLAAADSLLSKLGHASSSLDDLRKRIVATKEGGMITGEERLRENLTELYGNVVNYEGRPSATQVDRGTAIGRELGDVSKEFDRWMIRELEPLNALLTARNLPRIERVVP